ncbi:MAG: oxidoreductase [Ilumatobacter sp.]
MAIDMSNTADDGHESLLASPLELPCGLVLKNRLIKSAMSDSLGNGAGQPTQEQIELYRRWAAGGTALSLIGEVQIDHRCPEKPGNLVLGPQSDDSLLRQLADAGSEHGARIWPQLGHAGALAHAPISDPAGPSALDLDGLRCRAMSVAEIEALPDAYARAAQHAAAVGFSGVQIHAGHGFLLSQFLSPLFNQRLDQYGGSIEARSRLLVDVVRAIRAAVAPSFAVGMKINSADQLDGGLDEGAALTAIEILGAQGLDLFDISGGTYFPGAPASSDRRSSGPYFLEFAQRARAATGVPVMVTGGFKQGVEVESALRSGAADAVGLARAMVVDPDAPSRWLRSPHDDPAFPTFTAPPVGGVTAWYTMRLTAIGEQRDATFDLSLEDAVAEYEQRDIERSERWTQAFELPRPEPRY